MVNCTSKHYIKWYNFPLFIWKEKIDSCIYVKVLHKMVLFQCRSIANLVLLNELISWVEKKKPMHCEITMKYFPRLWMSYLQEASLQNNDITHFAKRLDYAFCTKIKGHKIKDTIYPSTNCYVHTAMHDIST